MRDASQMPADWWLELLAFESRTGQLMLKLVFRCLEQEQEQQRQEHEQQQLVQYLRNELPALASLA